MEQVADNVSRLTLAEGGGKEGGKLPMKPGLVYDSRMQGHINEPSPSHPEMPDRVSRIWQALCDKRLVDRCLRVESRSASKEEILKIHNEAHYTAMEETQRKEKEELLGMAAAYTSIYLHKLTFPCALLAAGSVVEMTEKLLKGEVRSGAAVVRPPGHHAEASQCMGFCIFNSVAIAACVAIDTYNLSRVLIVDWDVHHGNATQNQFYNDKRVLYFSLHRYDNGQFFPNRVEADSTHVGGASAEGYNINVAWNHSTMGDAEYIAAFHHLLLPVAYEFDPQLVLISAGFDAAQGDPLGRYRITPAGYAHMTHLLSGLAGGRMVIALEGGYNLRSISESMAACVGVLLGDPLPPLEEDMVPNEHAVECIRSTISAHVPYWKSLKLFGNAIKPSNPEHYSDTASPDFKPFQKQADKPSESHDTPPKSRDQEGGGAEGGGSESKDAQDRLLEELRELSVGGEMMFSVSPMLYCEHLSSLSPLPLPPDITSRRCEECDEIKEPWVCLKCHHVFCGRYINGHMVAHYESSGHPLAISLADVSVWCFSCDAYLDHASLRPAKNTVHRGKFGCNMDGTTD